MSNLPEFDSLNSVRYLYLRELSEPKDNSLRIVVDEAVGNRSVTGKIQVNLPELAGILKDSFSIETIEGCKAFELSWTSYVAYLVTEECVGSCGEPGGEIYRGDYFECIPNHISSTILREILARTQNRFSITS
jgi:hypothetical protein